MGIDEKVFMVGCQGHGGSICFRDSTETGTGTVSAGTTSLRSGLGTFFVPAPDHAKRFRQVFAYSITTILQTIDITVSSNV